MKNIAIFASGAATNADNIINYFKNNNKIKVAVLISNKTDSGIFKIGEKNNIPTLLINKEELNSEKFVASLKDKYKIDLIVLAGFLLLIPKKLIQNFEGRMINIHPSLLPKYGGKGMYGMNVHRAIFEAKEKETGISIHYVNEKFDEGKIIAQYKCNIEGLNSPEEIAKKNQQLEYDFFPIVIEEILSA